MSPEVQRQEPCLTPQELFAWLAGLVERAEVCVECGAGLGEISAFMSSRFSSVVATDIAPPRQGCFVNVTAAPAERIPARDESVDLVVSMQSLHLFDVKRHITEAQRALRRGGIFAALSYGEIVLPARVATAYRPTFKCIEEHWEEYRPWVISGYPGLRFKGRPVEVPYAAIVRRLTAQRLGDEIASWSATRQALRRGCDVAVPVLETIENLGPIEVRWPIVGKVFQRA